MSHQHPGQQTGEKDWSEMTPAERLASRFDHHDTWAIVASDTFDLLVERVTAMLSHERRMVLITRYANSTAADNLTIKTGLRLDDEPDYRGKVEPIKVNSSTFQNVDHRSFHVGLLPGINGFGFSTDNRDEAQRRPARDQRGEIYDSPVTAVQFRGRGASPGRDDLIEIEHWNEHRVCTLTTIAFQADWG